VVTSHASQGVTVDKVFVGISRESLAATDQRTAYVALTRGKEQAQIFTDDKDALYRVMCRRDDPMSATNLAESTRRQPTAPGRQSKSLTTAQQLAAVAQHYHAMQQSNAGHSTPDQDVSHDR
jgi:hypothetical protein